MHINADQDIFWYGLNGPFVLATLKLISGSGKISPEQNIRHAEQFVKHISDNLKLSYQKYNILKLLSTITYLLTNYFISVYQYHLLNRMHQMLQFLILL